jgi:uncharacterized protein (DUF2249 family)
MADRQKACIIGVMSNREILMDVRPLEPRKRHTLIFQTWAAMADGEVMILVNDHDPRPLYYQFSCEHTGSFHWQYQEEGPEVWKARITKGEFADPGYAPPPKMAKPCCAPADFATPEVLDVRPVFERGETPCALIEDAAAQTIVGSSFVLLSPFEPAPLYTKLGKEGFTHKSEQQPDGSWRIEFRKTA